MTYASRLTALPAARRQRWMSSQVTTHTASTLSAVLDVPQVIDDGGLAPGARVGGYIIVDELARGGMGIVYRALQPSLAREVALKLLPARLLDDEDLSTRFLREARAAGALSDERLVRIYDAGVHARGAWFTMALVDGTTLEKELALAAERRSGAAGGKLAPERALEVGAEVARALEALRLGGVVHRDVKPSNVLIARDGQVKLADLGLARTPDGGVLTLDGDFLGTPSYVAPEQAVDPRDADARSDLWSLGATLHHALFGRPPFKADSRVELLQRIITRDVRLPAEAERLPQLVRTTLLRLLARDPAERFETPAEAALALDRARASITDRLERRRAAARPRRRRPRGVGPVALVLFAAALGLALGAAVGVTCPTTRALVSP
jgi:eukaryotic-like serine/threonine-protein kinase